MKIEMEINATGQYKYLSFLKYYPTRFTVDNAYVLNRQVVYGFKGGHNTKVVAPLFIDMMKKYFAHQKVIPNDYWICAIPASTIEKTTKRFSAFCQLVSVETGANNGYSLVQPGADRDEVHMSDTRDYSHILGTLTFGDVKGKKVLLCDDVATTGKSFRIIADHLKQIGATSVLGFMLAKTHWLDEPAATI